MKPEKRWRSFLPPLPKQINDRDESEEQKDAAVYGIHTARLDNPFDHGAAYTAAEVSASPALPESIFSGTGVR